MASMTSLLSKRLRPRMNPRCMGCPMAAAHSARVTLAARATCFCEVLLGVKGRTPDRGAPNIVRPSIGEDFGMTTMMASLNEVGGDSPRVKAR